VSGNKTVNTCVNLTMMMMMMIDPQSTSHIQKSSTGIWDWLLWLLKPRSSGSCISTIVIPLAFVRCRGHTNTPLLTHYTNKHNVRGAKKVVVLKTPVLL
jgi:hypothetical protein